MTKPADEIRNAAHALRDIATNAIHEDRPTWSTGNTLGSKSPVVVDHPDTPSVLIETYAARLEAVNRYLALVGPATGLAVAKWLESLVGIEFSEGSVMSEELSHALAVARAINATA